MLHVLAENVFTITGPMSFTLCVLCPCLGSIDAPSQPEPSQMKSSQTELPTNGANLSMGSFSWAVSRPTPEGHSRKACDEGLDLPLLESCVKAASGPTSKDAPGTPVNKARTHPHSTHANLA
eukprot:732462-Pelagomonas_calceolata.AAC.4